MDAELTEAFKKVIERTAGSSLFRAVKANESGGGEFWSEIEDSGFLDALVPEAADGAGLQLEDISGILLHVGGAFVPAPLGETIILRGLLAAHAVPVPSGSLTFANSARHEGGMIWREAIDCGAVADHAIVELGDNVRILPLEGHRVPVTQPLALECSASWPAEMFHNAQEIQAISSEMLRDLQALLLALQAAGSMEVVLERTIEYAGQRVQFGQPIAKFQAIQHQIAIMAEHVVAARMAAIVAARAGVADRLHLAIAKARCSIAAPEVAHAAHSIHGAFGFTEECDLQLLTRRLHLWRQAAGSELVWQEEIGRMALAASEGPILDLLRRASEIRQ